MSADVEELLDEAETAIKDSNAVDLWRQSDARINAEELMEEVLGREISTADLDLVPKASHERKFRAFVERRVAGEPVAMITGKIEFYDMDLEVKQGVFIPRHSSELLVNEALRRIRRRKSPIEIDIATGAGPVALAIAKKAPHATVVGLDISPAALSVARRNASRLALSNVTFKKSDMLSALPRRLKKRVDAFTIHPPYVARDEIETLPTEIRAFEPVHTLTDRSDDGLGLVRDLAAVAPDWLKPGGWVLVEVSPNLSREVKSILTRNGLKQARSHRDSLGATRVIAGTSL